MSRINVSVLDALVNNGYSILGKVQIELMLKSEVLDFGEEILFDLIKKQLNDVLTKEQQRNLVISDNSDNPDKKSDSVWFDVAIRFASRYICNALFFDSQNIIGVGDKPFRFGLPYESSVLHEIENLEEIKKAIQEKYRIN